VLVLVVEFGTNGFALTFNVLPFLIGLTSG
jgi:hypothetical protein